MWQYVQNIIESKLNKDLLYDKLDRKLDLLTKQTGNTKTHKGNTQIENKGLINLTNIPFTKEQINTLKKGFYTYKQVFNILLVLNVKVGVF
jgi:hypothetical protein